jgi:hypothetical protein
MAIYSEWRNEDVANLIPDIRGELADPENINPKTLQAELNRFLDGLHSRAAGISESEDLRKFQSDSDSNALARVLNELERRMLDLKRVTTFGMPFGETLKGTEARNFHISNVAFPRSRVLFSF